MAFSITKFNKGGVTFDYNLPEGAEFKKCSDLGEGFTGLVRAIGVSKKGKYGDSPFIISDGFGVWVPSHMVETINEIRNDPEAVSAINNGKVCFTVYTYELDGLHHFSVNFIDATRQN